MDNKSIYRIYHGSQQVVKSPEIRTSKYNKDFYYGFYCTEIKEQAVRWATRFNSRGYVSHFAYTPDPRLKVLKFEGMTEEWLDFIVSSRLGRPHEYDIVEGPMADDTIFNYVQSFIEGKIPREAFWALVKFKYPTHQISFHTPKALRTLKFLEGEIIDV